MDYPKRLPTIARIISEHVFPDEIDRFLEETGIQGPDFAAIQPSSFDGEILAVDGSNAVVCGWGTAQVNLVRAGYAVYRKRSWVRTVITFNDLFLADPIMFRDQFNPFLSCYFDIPEIDLNESDLERLSSYYREMQEYLAIDDAIKNASSGDIILYDGSFEVFEPLRAVLATVFKRASQRGVALLAVSKSSSLSWGAGIALPFVQHIAIAGGLMLPGAAWYLGMKDRRIDAGQGRWGGSSFVVRFWGGSEHAFRVDAPSYLSSEIEPILGRIADSSCSAECLGYPHPLFRAHRDIRILEHEALSVREALFSRLSEGGMDPGQIRMLMQDYHDILEMRSGVW